MCRFQGEGLVGWREGVVVRGRYFLPDDILLSSVNSLAKLCQVLSLPVTLCSPTDTLCVLSDCKAGKRS